MKSRTSTCLAAMTLFAALAIPARLAAWENQDHKHHHYKLIDLGTFGGSQSYVNEPVNSFAAILNRRGMVTGWADTSISDPYPNFCFDADCLVARVFQWDDGQLSDLGVLPNGASSASTWISPDGLIAGYSENGQLDPLIPGLPEVHAVLWQNGGIADLGTLDGGFESLSTAVNNRAQVVGWSTNTVPDPFPFVDGGASQGAGYQTRAFIWQNGAMEDLGTLGTGTDATAWLVNERGQVAGDSFTNTILNTTQTCGQNVPNQDPFIWDNVHGLTDIGSLGGTCGFAVDLNNRGQVVGLSDLPGDQHWHAFLWDRRQHPNLKDLGTLGGGNSSPIANNDEGEITGWGALPGDNSIHAALWKHGKVTDLGAVGSDPCSLGFSINSTTKIVGISVPGCDFSNNPAWRAFLWEDGGPMVDLNTLVSPGSPLHLTDPDTINDRGEIAGFGFLPNGDKHAFLLIPCEENHANAEGCEDAGQDSNATQQSPAPINSAVTTATQPNLTPRGMAPGARPRLARGYRIPVIARPSAPHNQTASALNTYQTKLNWQEASGQNQSGFKIYRCHGCSAPRTQGAKIASAGASFFTYTDGSSTKPLTESTTYAYQVTAFNGGGESGPSNVAYATTKTEPAPTGLTSRAIQRGGFDAVELRWTNNSTDDDSYHVERCTGSTCTNFSEIANIGANATGYNDSFVSTHVTLRYRVRTHSPGGYSGYSNVRTQTTP